MLWKPEIILADGCAFFFVALCVYRRNVLKWYCL